MEEHNTITLLKNQGIKLREGEQVVRVIENLKSDQFKKISKVVITVLYLGAFIAYFFENSYLLAIFGILLLLEMIPGVNFIAKVLDKLLSFNIKGITIFTNKRIFLPSKRVIDWNEVYKLKRRVNGVDQYVVLDLLPEKIEYDLDGEHLYNTIEKSNFIFLGGEYDVNTLIDTISPYWLKESPVAKLEASKQLLMDKFDMRVSRKQNDLVMLTHKNEDFKLDHTHKNSFPITYYHATVEYNQPIPAFLTITMEGLGTQFKGLLGFKDIQIDNLALDKKLQILSSHTEQTKQLFTNEIIKKLQRILLYGSIELTFGTPDNRVQLNPNKSNKQQDSEAILDLQLATKNKEEEATAIDVKRQHKLSIKIKVKNSAGISENRVEAIADDFIAISLHFANGLNEIER